MRFREQPVSGFIVLHVKDNHNILTQVIRDKLMELDADMLDVQYSTHIDTDGSLINDILIVYIRWIDK